MLDVGCGTGLVGRALRARGYAGRIAGLDLSQASLEIAREGGAYDSLEQADLQQPWRSRTTAPTRSSASG